MKLSVQISRGIESLFGTRDENIRLLETGLSVSTHLVDDNLEIEGDEANAIRAASILEDYVALTTEGHVFSNGDLNSYLRVVTDDAEVTLRGLVASGKQRNFGKKLLAPKTINQHRYVDAIERNDLVFGVGPAGTGKTYLAVAMGVSALLNKKVSRIVLTRPAVEAGEKLGFLPGTLQEKVDPYLRPLYDALYDMIELERVERLLERNVIEVAPIAFMRGRTLNDAFIILDEAQNSTAEQMKMLLTRQGFNSRMVVNGDLTQIDLPPGKRSGLLDAIEVLRGVEGISQIFFDDRDVVRHPMVQRIVKAYERYYDSTGLGRQLSLKLDAQAEAETEPAAAPEASVEPVA
jgi:phosphate starvation-inducible protein PhoH and related proteins